jgi:dihydroorotate dehydrogenase
MVHKGLIQKEVRWKIVLLAAGGIGNAEDIFESILQGADACQALTLWPPEGPDFAKRGCKELVLFRRHGFSDLGEAVGKAR